MKLRVSVVTVLCILSCLWACPSQAATKKVVLTWTAPVPVPGITVTGYKVYRGLTAGGEAVNPFSTIVGNVVTFTDTNVSGGVSYFYKVTATAACDPTVFDCSAFVSESAASNEASSGLIPLPAAPAIGAPQAATAVVQ